VHCSDGWDRTAQLVTLAMVLLDPHYRTIAGFACLVRREWAAMGHCFATRSGHAAGLPEGKPPPEGSAPIFVQVRLPWGDRAARGFALICRAAWRVLPGADGRARPGPQWLDAVSQVVRQFPRAFEFGERLLAFLGREVYAAEHGADFAFDSERERGAHGGPLPSVWVHVERRRRAFVNPFYLGPAPGELPQLLQPRATADAVGLWSRMYLGGQPAQAEVRPPLDGLEACATRLLAENAPLQRRLADAVAAVAEAAAAATAPARPRELGLADNFGTPRGSDTGSQPGCPTAVGQLSVTPTDPGDADVFQLSPHRPDASSTP
jgi:hypothetical protein